MVLHTREMQIATLTFFQVDGSKDRFWALSQMQFGHSKMKDIEGVEFYRMLGSGRGKGFDWRPEWGRYALLVVWKNENYASKFFTTNQFFREYSRKATNQYTVYLKCFMVHGKWAGQEPFEVTEKYESGPVAVITRATIKTGFLWQFWRYVAPVAKSLGDYTSRLLSVGIGEWPIVQQATFSIWKDLDAVKHYAYENQKHSDVVKKTRELGWYKEELFSRFIPYKSEGNWYGNDPLKDHFQDPNK